MLAVARVGVQKGATHSDDGVRSQHLQLEVGVVGDRHELDVAWPSQDGMVGPWEVHHLKGEDLRAEVGLVTKCDGQVNLLERVCLRSRDHAMEGRAHWMELRPGDAHGVEGVDIEDVVTTASVHQHLGETLLMNDGVDNERVTSQSRDMGGMVPLIEGDQRFRPAKEGGDGSLGNACLPIAYLVLALGPDDVRSTEDHDAFIGIRETISVFARRASFLGCRIFVVPFFRPAGLS